MPETSKKIVLAKGYAISTIRHLQYDPATQLLEATCFVDGNDRRARFMTRSGRTTAAYLRIAPGDLDPFIAEVFAAFPAGTFERLELGGIVSYRRKITHDETVTASGKPHRNRSGFDPRHRHPIKY